MVNKNIDWKTENADVFWGEIAPCNHLVQIYEQDEEILSTLETYIEGGFKKNESVVVIATLEHIDLLSNRLKKDHDLISLNKTGMWVPLNANEVLSKFMKVGWPNENLFNETIAGVIKKARGTTNRKIRAYGEMVAILWSQGYNGATVQLEHLWNKFCEKEELCLLCAYPRTGFTQDIEKSIQHICSMHTQIITNGNINAAELKYKPLS